MAALDSSTRYGDLCRLCATKTGLILGVNIYANEGTLRQIDKKIVSCLSIQVHENDELPKMICEHCLYKLELLYDFRERAVRTEAFLIELYKEVSSSRGQGGQVVKLPHTMNVVEDLDHPDLILVQQHQLLTHHNMQNVAELDLQHLENRHNIIVENEIILAHQGVDMNTHSLDGIDLNHHDLSEQDLSNHSLHAQEMLVDNSSNVHEMENNRYTTENLELIHQQQLLSDQYSLPQELPAEMADPNCNLGMNEESKIGMEVKDNHPSNRQDKILHSLITMEKHENFAKEVAQRSKTSGNSDQKEIIINEELMLKHEDSNSENRLLIDDTLDDTIQGTQTFSQVEKPVTEETSAQSWYFCNVCNKSIEKTRCNEHFYECKPNESTTMDENPLATKSPEGSDDENFNANEEMLDSSKNSDEEDEPYEQSNEQDPQGKRKKWTPKICKHCGKTYKSNYKLTEHMRQHTGEKPYKCGSCEKAFRSKIGLAQHEAKHTGKYDYACPTCGKGFQCKSYLMVHQRVHSDVKPYPCTTCGQNFKTKQSLLDHTNRHLGVKPYMCETCGRGFITKGLCKAHQRIHTGTTDNKKYPCKVCNKMFVSKSYLQTHLRIHTGEKPFICEVCGKGFLTRVDLRIHSTMHTGEKSYVCEMCGKAFARRDALRCHRRSHTGERPYSCDLCGQTFTQFSPMAIHKRLHTGERPYSCETCGKTFVSRSTMVSHSKKHVR